MLIHWIWLATRPDMTDRNRMVVLQHFQDAEDVYFAKPEAYASIELLSAEGKRALQNKNLTGAEKILAECAEKNIKILTYADADYPERLRNIADPPLVLYYKGRLPDCDEMPLIGVVGTRRATAYGLTTAKRMGYQIASCGGIVVSGLAFGIDGMAMAGALMAGSPVIGVLGCGADVVYPMSNRHLFEDVERNGCILTEFPPGTPPKRWNFPRRNRIISGLSCGVLVVEAPEKSGALITAQQAADQGRDVFVVPGNIDVSSCAGSNALLRDGAAAVSCGWDVMEEYESLYPGKVRCNMGPALAGKRKIRHEVSEQTLKVAQNPKILDEGKAQRKLPKKKEVDNNASRSYIDAEVKLPALSANEEKIVALVKQGTTLADEIIAQTELPANVVLSSLTMLEIKGVIRRLPGKRVEMKK